MDNSTLRISNLSTGYRRKTVACGLTASLTGGTMCCLLGGNGAGKSTLLHTICGLLPTLGGEVFIGERKLTTFSPKDLSRAVAIVLTHRPQELAFTAREMIAMGRQPHTGAWGRLSAEDERIIDESLRLTQAENLANRRFGTLSDGERQRIMIGKALAQQTPLILLDEPTAFLDFGGKIATLALLKRLAHESGKTVLLSTHDLEPAFCLADNLWLLSADGIQSGSPRELADKGILSAFFDSPAAKFHPESLRFEYSEQIVEQYGVH